MFSRFSFISFRPLPEDFSPFFPGISAGVNTIVSEVLKGVDEIVEASLTLNVPEIISGVNTITTGAITGAEEIATSVIENTIPLVEDPATQEVLGYTSNIVSIALDGAEKITTGALQGSIEIVEGVEAGDTTAISTGINNIVESSVNESLIIAEDILQEVDNIVSVYDEIPVNVSASYSTSVAATDILPEVLVLV